MSIIKYLEVTKFRSVPTNQKIPIGSMLTVISGRNATCKTTILGMLGQPFGKDRSIKDVFGNTMRTEFSEIFKMSVTHDPAGAHEYTIGLAQPFPPYEGEVQVKSRLRKDAPARLVTGKSHESGFGNISIPVAYLGLRRLFPIGETKHIVESVANLSAGEARWFERWYRKIMAASPVSNINMLNSKAEKQTLAVSETTYESSAISAGQDNTGRILGAIISFMRLRAAEGRNYKGGLLLVDEIDATMHASSQARIVDLFYEAAKDLKLQIIVTTHSPYMLENISSHALNDGENTKILYFMRERGALVVSVNPTAAQMNEDLQLLLKHPGKNTSLPKLNLYSEDNEAKLFLKNLLPDAVQKRLKINKESFGIDQLRLLAVLADRMPELQNAIYLLDGDAGRRDAAQNVIKLPGDKRPESIICDFLDNLAENDEFWNNDKGYTKERFNDRLPINNERGEMKKWFNKQIRDGCWGNKGVRIFKRWKEANADIVADFNEKFVEAFNFSASKSGVPLVGIQDKENQ